MAKVIKHKRKESLPRRIFLVCNATFLIIFALICLVPFFNLLAISLSDSSAVDAGNVGLVPVGFNFTAYEFLLKKKEFWTAFGVSVERVLLGTILSLVVNILAAYPLSRPKKYFKGRKFYVVILVITMFFNGGIVPTYIIISKLGIMNTMLALIFPTALNAWNIVLLISFFREVPNELIEAAEMDGAGQYQILFKVVLPISLPALATVTLFTAVAHWNNWFDGYMYMNPSKYPLQTYIYNMINEVNQLQTNPNITPEQQELLASLPGKTLRSAQIFIAMLPIMLVYPFVQKYFIKGLTQGGVKE
jgi:putative aldouronate transport system permease protein